MPARLLSTTPDAANIIAEHRASAGLTQPQLAQRIGTSPDTIGRIESGAYGTTFRKRVKKFIAVLKINDPEEKAVLLRTAEASSSHAQRRGRVPTLRVVQSSEGPLDKDDPLIVALCAAIEHGSVEGDQVMELTKQILFLRGIPWYTD
jgi:transcriptional regulator with XRE-family HTH domain